MTKVRFIGLDVHADTIAVAVAEPGGEIRSLGVVPNRPESIRKLVKKLGPAATLRVCYEAGPTGYVVYWQLSELGMDPPPDMMSTVLVPFPMTVAQTLDIERLGYDYAVELIA